MTPWPRLNTHAALSEPVGNIQLQAAAAWGVAPAEFSFTVAGLIMDPSAPLVPYVTGGAVLEAVAPGPR